MTEPERALAIIDTIEMKKETSSGNINYMRLMVYNNGLGDYKMSEYYASQVLNDTVWLKKNPNIHCFLAILLSDFARQNGRYAKCLKYAKQALETARSYNKKEYELSAQAAIAHSLRALGDQKSALKIFAEVNEEMMKECGKSSDFETLNTAFTFIGNYFEVLMENKLYKEAGQLIPDIVTVNDNIGKVGSHIDGAVENRRLHTYSMLMQYYDYCGKKEESAKYQAKIVKSNLADTEFIQFALSKHYFIVKDNDKLAEIVASKRQREEMSNDTLSKYFIDNVLEYEKYLCVAKGNYRKALEKSEAIRSVMDSVSRKEKDAEGNMLAKIYETQEKERLLIEKDAQLSMHQNIFIGVAAIMVVGTAFIVILLLLNRKVNRRSKTIVSTINRMMRKEDELTRLRLANTDNAKNVNPDELRLMQSLEMLKDDKSIDEIATLGGYRNAKAFTKKFYEHFGIPVEEYRKWSKNISEQEKAGADEAKHMKDSFIRNMSHEIRTPLNQIFGFVQLLTDPGAQLTDDEKRSYNDIIASQTTYMTHMLN
ncbi:MAG: histidine kinase dimerization/phospho-acceptor domain-containing protein, partial [Prevotella sp.]